jgi:hypothetical protein
MGYCISPPRKDVICADLRQDDQNVADSISRNTHQTVSRELESKENDQGGECHTGVERNCKDNCTIIHNLFAEPPITSENHYSQLYLDHLRGGMISYRLYGKCG